jgi:hypothetical protein
MSKRLILDIRIRDYLNRYMRNFLVRKLNLVARITGKLLDGKFEKKFLEALSLLPNCKA